MSHSIPVMDRSSSNQEERVAKFPSFVLLGFLAGANIVDKAEAIHPTHAVTSVNLIRLSLYSSLSYIHPGLHRSLSLLEKPECFLYPSFFATLLSHLLFH